MAAAEMDDLFKESAYLEKIVGFSSGERISLYTNDVVLSNSFKDLNHDIFTVDHCCLKRDEYGWCVMDLKSIPGTYLNGEHLKPLIPYRLRNGFVIFLGHPLTAASAFTYRIKEIKQKADMDDSTENPFKEEYLKAKSKLLDCQKDLESLKEYDRKKSRNSIKRMLELDFACAICTEILIKPVLLKCSHSFCRRCIWKWKRKQNRCPICRKRIISGTENDALDYFINSSTELLDEDYQEKRREALSSRTKAEEDDTNDASHSNSCVHLNFEGISPLHLPVLRHSSSSHIRYSSD